MACIYDGYNLRLTIGKVYMMIGYLQKIIIAIVLVNSIDPFIQVLILHYYYYLRLSLSVYFELFI
jgi:hypothetical protein